MSENNIIGNNLLFEHVHPNQMGYLQIAKTIARTMSNSSLISKFWDWEKALTDSEYLSMSNLTTLDKEIVNAILCKLTAHWPFTEKHRKSFERIGDEKTEELAKKHIDQNISVVDLHVEYARFLESKNKLDEAIMEYESALSIYPVNQIYNSLGRMYLIKTERSYRDSKKFALAYEYFTKGESYFKEGLRSDSNNLELNFNLSLLYLMRKDRWCDAENRLKKVLALNPGHQKALLLLSQLYIRSRRMDEAKTILQKGIENFPQVADFYSSLGTVCIYERRYPEARKYLEKAIALGNDIK
ncbi:MAG: tetratricopeptide repeat protein, partial [Leptospiraceae bacterium]|nr:tetratricopeptide repeat protein [Leptospiraceae bacterium]